MSEPIIRTEELTLTYGRKLVLDGVSISVPKGAIYALLGSNGAGKSSLVRCLIGTQPWNGGVARISDRDCWRERSAIAKIASYVPEDSDLPLHLNVAQTLRCIRAIRSDFDADEAAGRLENAGVSASTMNGDLSKGESKQVALAIALASHPEILILDDPTLGLDPGARRKLIEEVLGLISDRPTSILMTTHDLPLAENVAEHVAILHDGRIALEESIEAIRNRFRTIVTSEAEVDWPDARVRRVGSGAEIRVTDFDDQRASRAFPAGSEIRPMTLEEVYTAVTEGENR